MPTYGWLTKTQATDALLGRLNNAAFWNAAEAWVCITEALRHWNGLVEQWNTDVFFPPPTPGAWINTGTSAGSPRLRSVTDSYLYTQMEYMLLEPPSGGTWTGTSQFDLASLQYSLQKRTQEVIQATACNLAQLAPLNATPGNRRNVLPDTVLEQRRTRFLSAPQFSIQTTLTREDTESFQAFQPSYPTSSGNPQSWSVASEPPLAFDTDEPPNVPGTFDVLALVAGPTFNPPAASLLGVPDDWTMVCMYGALADVVGRESESTDRQRAAYCLSRYTQMLEMMKQSNWLTDTSINGQSAGTVALVDMDAFATGWQQLPQVPNSASGVLPCIVEAGMDLVAPTPQGTLQLGLTLVGNAPLLDSTGVYVQVSRDDAEAVLNYAQHLASFKMGGAEFAATMPLLQDFYRAAGERNKRWLNYGIFVDAIKTEGTLQQMAEAR